MKPTMKYIAFVVGTGLCMAAALWAGVVLTRCNEQDNDSLLHDPPRATGADVALRVEAEFSLHGQECVVVGVFVRDELKWHRLHRFTDCGHGLTPGSMRPTGAGADGGTYNDGWWDDRLGMR